jgi:hypothetical protein
MQTASPYASKNASILDKGSSLKSLRKTLLPSKRSDRVFLPPGESNIVLFDFHPGKLAAFRSESVALTRQLLLFGQSSLPAASHSSRDTIFGSSIVFVDILILPFI